MASKKAIAAPKTEKAKKTAVETNEKVMGYFRKGSTVGLIASILADERTHKIDSILAKARSELKISEKAATFALNVLCVNLYPGGATGKIEYKKLGGVVFNMEEGTVAYSPSKRKTEIIRPKKEEKPEQKVEVEAKA